MRLSYPYILLVLAAVSHVNFQATASDSVKLAPRLNQPDVTALEHGNEHKALRDYSIDADDEERAIIDFMKVFDVRKWFRTAVVQNVEKDFKMETVANMLATSNDRKRMFKVWDKFYSLPEVTKQLADFRKHKRVADLLADYTKHRQALNLKAKAK